MPRLPVTEQSVRAYLDRSVNSGNYALFHGLHRLPREYFLEVMDLLINGEAFPEELHRLGSFSAQEAATFIQDLGTRWNSKFLAVPDATGTGGYDYYVNDLGLLTLLQAARLVEDWAPLPLTTYTGASFRTGGLGDHESPAALAAEWTTVALPEGLAACGAESLAKVFPSTDGEFLALNLPNRSVAREELFLSWAKPIFSPLSAAGSGGESAVRALYWVDGVPSGLAAAPSLAQFILAGTRPYRDAQLRLHRKISSNRAGTPEDITAMNALVASVTAARPNEWGTSSSLSQLDFDLRLAGAWGQVANGGVMPVGFEIARDALQAVFDHREVVRRFIWGAYLACRRAVYGTYPEDVQPIQYPFAFPSFGLSPSLSIIVDSDGYVVVDYDSVPVVA